MGEVEQLALDELGRHDPPRLRDEAADAGGEQGRLAEGEVGDEDGDAVAEEDAVAEPVGASWRRVASTCRVGRAAALGAAVHDVVLREREQLVQLERGGDVDQLGEGLLAASRDSQPHRAKSGRSRLPWWRSRVPSSATTSTAQVVTGPGSLPSASPSGRASGPASAPATRSRIRATSPTCSSSSRSTAPK